MVDAHQNPVWDQMEEEYRLMQSINDEISDRITLAAVLYTFATFLVYIPAALTYGGLFPIVILLSGTVAMMSLRTIGFYRYFSSVDAKSLWHLIKTDYSVLVNFFFALVAPYIIIVFPLMAVMFTVFGRSVISLVVLFGVHLLIMGPPMYGCYKQRKNLVTHLKGFKLAVFQLSQLIYLLLKARYIRIKMKYLN